ncbi:hypothetical protein KRP22_002690 [Phytophthora ramorum]|nr:hypothetical protein KRP22_6337 [Phytophthora ramorum]
MRYDQQQPSDNRPKLFMAPPMQPPYGHYLPHGIPHHTPLKYENGAAPYLPPSMPDYQAPPNDTPSSAKRSREELNMKEKQRMFKLNERISQLRELLDAAGMQTKKNKQSVLDNTAHFVEKLQTDLKVAQQKAARAEKQAESFRALAPRGDKVLRRAFESSSTPRLVVDLQCHTLAFNAAFVKHTGLAEPTLKKKKTLRQFVCVDQEKLDKIVDKIRDTKKTDSGEAVNVEFSLIPVDVQQQRPQQASTKRRKVDVKSDEKQMPGKDPTTGGDKHADESAIYVHL